MTDARHIKAGGGRLFAALLAIVALAYGAISVAAEPAPLAGQVDPASYKLQSGDVLAISVWKENELRAEVLVRPDGALSFPLVGEVVAAGRTVEEVRTEIASRLAPFVPSPVVTVAIKGIGGNRVFVIGKVNRPGEIPLLGELDVMQALSLAGGVTTYAAVNDIVILRRENGAARSIRFRYTRVASGKDLQQNILLRSGDTVVVP